MKDTCNMLNKKQIKAQTNELLFEYKNTDCPPSKKRKIEDAIIKLNTPLLLSRINRYNISEDKKDDFLQETSIGLTNAIRRFDMNRGTAFSTYAVTYIDGAIYNAYRDKEWVLGVIRTDKEKGVKIANMSQDELALYKLSDDEIKEAKALINAQTPQELTQEQMDNLSNNNEPNMDEMLDITVKQNLIELIFKSLPEEDSHILKAHYIDGFSEAEIAIAMIRQISEIKEIISSAISKCQELFKKDPTQ